MPASRRSASKSVKGLAKGAVNLGSRAVRGTVRTAKNTVTTTAKAATETVDFARDFSKLVVLSAKFRTSATPRATSSRAPAAACST